jgi:hypothetical protein
MSKLSPVSGVERKSDFGIVRSAFDPLRTFDRFRLWAWAEVSVPVLTLAKVDLQILSQSTENRI